jgi:hypothetical protein
MCTVRTWPLTVFCCNCCCVIDMWMFYLVMCSLSWVFYTDWLLYRNADCPSLPHILKILSENTNDITMGLTRINVCRGFLWECTKRALKRKTFCASAPLQITFTDDVGVSEGAIDQGGPRREFFTILTDYLVNESPVFIGKRDKKHLTLFATGDLTVLFLALIIIYIFHFHYQCCCR